MTPKLVAVAGPLKATVLPLTEKEFSIGRDPSNVLVIDDLSVSRCHCVISRDEASICVRDLESHNGTFVNELPIKERILEHGDRLTIGTSLFLVLLSDVDELPNSNNVQIEDDRAITKSGISLRVEDALYSLTRDLTALLRVSAAINSARGSNALQQELLLQIFEVVPAERGAIILGDQETGEFTSVFALERNADPQSTIHVSSNVVKNAIQKGVAILGEAGRDDEPTATAGFQSVLCVPLMLLGKALGAIYLEIKDGAVRFNKSHLQLVSAIANIAAGVLENIRWIELLESENERLIAESNIEHNMIGESAPMKEIYQLIGRVAPTNSTVLIRGESGTGKELAARAIHQNSLRKSQPFIAVNCAALAETLLESELFGHERGAFTGAVAQKKGKLELANGGTIFLDEVGEMATGLQAKILRVLQEREFERVGGTRSIKADLRIIAATNKDLEAAIKQGTFRSDLYYRLNVISFTMPPLRHRREDTLLLAKYFAVKYGRQCKRRITGISSEGSSRLLKYDWPGNVRELENAIERAVVLGTTETILPDDLPETLLELESIPGVEGLTYYDAIKEAKRNFILNAFNQAGSDYAETARILGVHPNNLHRLIRNLNLKDALKR
jgi:transcriptional regulator with GAF, ATPase, and Fis domain